ncbi:hypothetical protein P4O66_002885 [Electrophorus voltai]|uniref:Neuregulin 2 N-terminal domain-containing protein n=1 Tax=Electrophorus voltai TaxID=2609070 RepID=A0AAD8YWU4_9TELE|nr:hypothetical protein P4O66_002885 [Electrophorus voltai]
MQSSFASSVFRKLCRRKDISPNPVSELIKCTTMKLVLQAFVCKTGVSPLQNYREKSSGSRWHGHLRKVCRAAVLLEPVCSLFLQPSSTAIAPQPREPCRNATSDHRAKAGGMRLESVHFSMLVIGVSFACYSPSLNSLQDRVYKSAVVIEGKVQSAPQNISAEPYSVNVKVLDVWPRNSGGLEREQLVTVGEFGSETPCAKVIKNHKYIFFMDPTDEPLVFKASFAPLDASGKNLKKDVGRILCEDCDPGDLLFMASWQLLPGGFPHGVSGRCSGMSVVSVSQAAELGGSPDSPGASCPGLMGLAGAVLTPVWRGHALDFPPPIFTPVLSGNHFDRTDTPTRSPEVWPSGQPARQARAAVVREGSASLQNKWRDKQGPR